MKAIPTAQVPSLLDPRFFDKARAQQLLEVIDRHSGLTKTASDGTNPTTALLTALSEMDLQVRIDLGELIKKVKATTDNEGISKTARTVTDAREEHIIIASKECKDSHYQIDVSKDLVTKKDKRIQLVSLYLRDAYLGRYMIKRNFFFAGDNTTDVNDMFDDMVRRANQIKRRYYDDKILVNGIFAEVKAYTDGLRGDVEFKDDDV